MLSEIPPEFLILDVMGNGVICKKAASIRGEAFQEKVD